MAKDAALALAIALLTSFGAEEASGQARIVVVAPLSGSDSSFGAQVKNGAELAAKLANDTGGLLNQKIIIETIDDQCDIKTAISVAFKLAITKPTAVIGHVCEDETNAASVIYAEQQILHFSPAAVGPELTEDAATRKWKTIFRTIPRFDAQGTAAGEYIYTNLRRQNVAIVSDESVYGAAAAEKLKVKLVLRAIPAQYATTVSSDTATYDDLVENLRQNEIDVIYLGTSDKVAANIVRAVRGAGFSGQILGTELLASRTFVEMSGEHGRGTLITVRPNGEEMKGVKDLGNAFSSASVRPVGYTVNSFAAVQVLIEAVKKTRSLDPLRLSEMIRAGRFDTILGEVTFDEKGDLVADYYEWQVMM